jgi:hypothetical protein
VRNRDGLAAAYLIEHALGVRRQAADNEGKNKGEQIDGFHAQSPMNNNSLLL